MSLLERAARAVLEAAHHELVPVKLEAALIGLRSVTGPHVCTGACLCDPQPGRCREVAGELRCELAGGHGGQHRAWTVEERGVYTFAVPRSWGDPLAGGSSR